MSSSLQLESSLEADEPTMVLRVVEEYRQSRRKSILTRNRAFSERQTPRGLLGMAQPPPKRPNFEEDQEESFQEKRRRRDTDNGGQKEREEALRKELSEKEALLVDAKTQARRWEQHAKRMEVNEEREREERRRDKEKADRDVRRAKEEVEEMRHKIKVMKRKEARREEDEGGERRETSRIRFDLEEEASSLREENLRMEEERDALREEAEEARRERQSEEESLRRELRLTQSLLEEERALRSVGEGNGQTVARANKDKEAAQIELERTRKEVEELQRQLRLNEEAKVERRAMKDRLEKYPELVRQNESLRMENKLLHETMENTELLREQMQDLKERFEQADAQAKEGMKAKADLSFAMRRIKQWERICLNSLSAEEQAAVGQDVSPDNMEQKVGEMRRKEITLRGEMTEAVSKIKHLQAKSAEVAKEMAALKSEETKLKNYQTDAGQLVKRLQRKLLLVSKERNSYKEVLDSYEHELTFTGGQFEKDKMAAQEKIIQSKMDMIEKLEAQLKEATASDAQGNKQPGSSGSQERELSEANAKIQSLSEALGQAQNAREALQYELERRAMRGDFNPADTKVLQFSNNPTAQAVAGREQEFKRLSDENEALKTRVKLLEEGQTSDLTMLVGQKMEEGASSKDVLELKEQLRLAEVRKTRLIDAFKKTSQDFREVCFQLTGYRIDGLADSTTYRLTPIYAENSTDHLLFKRDDRTGECSLLETAFSSQLSDLIELHLAQQNSIPVFLSAVTTDLFSRMTFQETTTVGTNDSEDEEEERDDTEDEEEVEQEEEEDVEDEAGGDDDDPICID